MKYIVCPDEWDERGTALFLGGGISGCPNWQWEMSDLLADTGLVLLNPRRKNFPMDDPNAAEVQIEWEFRHLKNCCARMFWFPCETLCPITLFELGKWCQDRSPLFVGAHPEYQRLLDLRIQLRLARPGDSVVQTDLCKLADQVKRWEGTLSLINADRTCD
jgi:hypothetical protein